MGIRFISVNDGFDSDNERFDESLICGLKCVFNEYHLNDLSRKIKSGISAKIRSENYMPPGPVPYGYAKSSGNPCQYILDHYKAAIVRRIFEMRLCGHSPYGIAKVLNKENIPAPGKNFRKPESPCFWTDTAITTMIKNPVYFGAIATGKTISTTIHSHSHAPKDQWKYRCNSHQPIVSESEFQMAQLPERHRSKGVASESSFPLAGKTVCGCCGHALKLNISKTKLFCKYKRYFAANGACLSKEVKTADIELIVSSRIKELKRYHHEISSRRAAWSEWDLLQLAKLKQENYMRYSLGQVGEQEYESLRDHYRSEEENLRGGSNDSAFNQKLYSEVHQALDSFDGALTKDLVATLVKEVSVSDDIIKVIWASEAVGAFPALKAEAGHASIECENCHSAALVGAHGHASDGIALESATQ
jgi:hypothetical protein